MPKLPARRTGTQLVVKSQVVPFSFWPTVRTTRRFGLQDRVFSSNPWAVMRVAIRNRARAARRDEALAFIAQAEEFYTAASVRLGANPLLLYYCFMNVAKALAIVQNVAPALDRAAHGLSEQTVAGGREIRDSSIAFVGTGSRPNVFQLLAQSLGYSPPASGTIIPVMDLLPQIVIGHRLFRSAQR